MFNKKPSVPTEPCKITLSVDQIQPYKYNPRKAENKKKDELKLSIRKRGFKGELTVTLRPGADTYELSYGANTTYVVIKELWDETQDPRFEHIPCSFEPWDKESTLLIDSLIENGARDDLIFIDKACGLVRAWKALESESGETLSQRELSKQLHEGGGSYSQALISQLQYAAEILLPLIPLTLGEGLGKHRVIQLRKLHSAARKTWESLKEGEIETFESLYAEALATTDTHEWDFDHTLRVVGGALSEPTGKSAASVSAQILLILEERPGKDWGPPPSEHDLGDGSDTLMSGVLGTPMKDLLFPSKKADKSKTPNQERAPTDHKEGSSTPSPKKASEAAQPRPNLPEKNDSTEATIVSSDDQPVTNPRPFEPASPPLSTLELDHPDFEVRLNNLRNYNYRHASALAMTLIEPYGVHIEITNCLTPEGRETDSLNLAYSGYGYFITGFPRLPTDDSAEGYLGQVVGSAVWWLLLNCCDGFKTPSPVIDANQPNDKSTDGSQSPFLQYIETFNPNTNAFDQALFDDTLRQLSSIDGLLHNLFVSLDDDQYHFAKHLMDGYRELSILSMTEKIDLWRGFGEVISNKS